MILVTGASGFIGSVLVKELNLQGRKDIWIVDRLESDEKWRNLSGLEFEDYIHADELFGLDPSFWDNITQIFHIGACSSTTERDMDFLWENNVRYSQELFNIATIKDIPILYASSAATYGDGEHGYSDDHREIKNLRPLNGYGFSKHYVDKWVLDRESRPSYWFGLKFFNVFGPNEYHKEEMRSLVHKGFGQIKETGKVKLFKSHREGYKDGEQLRDFVYVKDIVRAALALMKEKVPGSSGLYNMGTGQARSFYDLIKATFAAMEVKVNVEFIPMPESIRDQYQYYTQAEMKKFNSVFPEFEFTSLEDSVSDYVKNYLMKPNPYY
jgi:ADP-L-glycero-D-manno-heptose 6-epimerase